MGFGGVIDIKNQHKINVSVEFSQFWTGGAVVNKSRRESLAKAVSMIEEAKSILEDVGSDESDAMYGLEEHFSETERYSMMESNVDILEDSVSSLDDVLSSLESVA